ncbi:MAG TPA: GTP 3',8-cyclase MoaA [Armatimonadota bacterium]|nr:GTP 3',8-cyclase MoaA [Armatimonadota bacterium]
MTSLSGLTDSFGRRIDYLRISVTERCDLRCAYCHPQGHTPSHQPDLLSADDVAAIAAAAVQIGIRRIRLTGGEPLLRSDVEEICSRLRLLPGLEDLALTTNGQRLAGRAAGLAAAGLMRVNVSLDSLDPEVYAALTGGGDLEAVLGGLDASLTAGLTPVKVNVVLTSPASVEGADLLGFAALIRRRPIHVRFIEAMPVCSHVSYLPAEHVLDRFSQIGRLDSVSGPEGGGPARYYRLDDSRGTIGIIAPISDPFCSHCNRLRISARADLVPCLFSPAGISLLPALRREHPAAGIADLVQQAVAAKPCRYGDVAVSSGIAGMHVIGG